MDAAGQHLRLQEPGQSLAGHSLHLQGSWCHSMNTIMFQLQATAEGKLVSYRGISLTMTSARAYQRGQAFSSDRLARSGGPAHA